MLGQSILPRSLYSGSEEKERDEAADISLLLAAVEYPPTEYRGSDQPLQNLYLPPITALEPLAGCPSVSTCTQLCLLLALSSVTWHELQQHSLSPSRPTEPAYLLRCNSGEVSTL